jgi:TrmH family RNA methyltransferase
MTLSKTRSSLLQRLRRRKQRHREGCFIVEGVRSCRAAIFANTRIRFAVISPRLAELDSDGALIERLGRARVEVAEVNDKELEGLAETVTPQGILMVCEEPKAGFDELGDGAHGLLVADAVQDPGNLGGMIRTAAALGLSGLIALDGTVDPWNAKVVRGSAGASFRLPVVQTSCSDALAWLAAGAVRLLVAETDGDNIATVDKTPPWAVAIGNEGAGLRRELRAAAAATVAVPLQPHSDSLNAGVAAAILCYELKRENSP